MSTRAERATARAAAFVAEATTPATFTAADLAALSTAVVTGGGKLAQQTAQLLEQLRTAQAASEDTAEYGLYVRAEQTLAVWQAEAASLDAAANRISLARLQMTAAVTDLAAQLAALPDPS